MLHDKQCYLVDKQCYKIDQQKNNGGTHDGSVCCSEATDICPAGANEAGLTAMGAGVLLVVVIGICDMGASRPVGSVLDISASAGVV